MADNELLWWQSFFSEPNQLSWNDLNTEDNSWAKYVNPWLKHACEVGSDIPVILPFVSPEGKAHWYCAAKDESGMLKLREALQSFIGSSYSDFTGRPHTLNDEDPIEAAFSGSNSEWVFKISPRDDDCVERIQHALDLYLRLLERRPKFDYNNLNSLRILRAEFDRSVAVGDKTNARAIIDKIKNIGRLDAENLLYMEVELRAGLGDWESIAYDSSMLHRLNGLRLPRRILLHVHEALYRTFIERFEEPASPSNALDVFREKGLHTKTALFGTNRGIKAARVLKSFFLFELSRDELDLSRLQELASDLKSIGDEFSSSLITLLPENDGGQRKTESYIDAADEAFHNFDIEKAFKLYFLAPPSRKRLSQLIRCAEDIGTRYAAQQVLDSIDSDFDVSKLSSGLLNKLEQLRDLCSSKESENQIGGWLDWARAVVNGLSSSVAIQIVRENETLWDIKFLNDNKEQIDELTGLINNATGECDLIFREFSPNLFRRLLSEVETLSRLVKPLLQILVTKVAFFSDPSEHELGLVRDIVDTLMMLGLDKDEYTDLISDLEDLMGIQLSSQRLSWALDLIEILTLNSCPDHEARLRISLKIIEETKRIKHRMLISDKLVVKELCKDLDIIYPEESYDEGSDQIVDNSQALMGKKIGIYTLMEGAGQRAALLLQEIYPGVEVEVNNDHECTQALTNLAKTADFFVFSWRCSKHQAFYCIKKHRSESEIIKPEGKGASSILRAIVTAT